MLSRVRFSSREKAVNLWLHLTLNSPVPLLEIETHPFKFYTQTREIPRFIRIDDRLGNYDLVAKLNRETSYIGGISTPRYDLLSM